VVLGGIPRPAPRQPALSDLPSLGRVHLLGRTLHRHHDRNAAQLEWDEIPPTGKSFEVDFYTVAQWDEGQIVEENLMYDLVTFLKQLGLSE